MWGGDRLLDTLSRNSAVSAKTRTPLCSIPLTSPIRSKTPSRKVATSTTDTPVQNPHAAASTPSTSKTKLTSKRSRKRSHADMDNSQLLSPVKPPCSKRPTSIKKSATVSFAPEPMQVHSRSEACLYVCNPQSSLLMAKFVGVMLGYVGVG